MIYQRAALVLLALTYVDPLTAQELRAQDLRVAPDQDHRSLWLGDFFSGVHDIFCPIFDTCGDEEAEEENPNPIKEIITDILDPDDGSTPIRDAINATIGSETPLRDFLAELLDQPGSTTPVSDFIDEAFNRSDTPFLDFIADLFDTVTSTPIRDFVRDLINGTTTPLQDAIGEFLEDDVFADLNCDKPADAPPCAYNLEGDDGVWVCRTLYNPFRAGEVMNATHCAHPEFTLKDNDKCGSCDGSYPAPCSCTCTTDEGSDGVYITLLGESGKQCVNAKWANNALNRFDAVRCSSDC